MDSQNGEKSESVAVLRDIWAADDGAAAAAELDICLPTAKVCKNTAMLGIKGMEDPAMASAQQGEWRKQMLAEGKASISSRSIGEEFAAQIQSAPQD